MKRTVFEVRFSLVEELWIIRRRDSRGMVLAYEHTRAAAIRHGADIARRAVRAQLVVYTRRGTISFERTYKADPKRREG